MDIAAPGTAHVDEPIPAGTGLTANSCKSQPIALKLMASVHATTCDCSVLSSSVLSSFCSPARSHRVLPGHGASGAFGAVGEGVSVRRCCPRSCPRASWFLSLVSSQCAGALRIQSLLLVPVPSGGRRPCELTSVRGAVRWTVRARSPWLLALLQFARGCVRFEVARLVRWCQWGPLWVAGRVVCLVRAVLQVSV